MSGNKCAFPDCQNPIWTENGTLIGYMCHIEAQSPGGARYNPTQTPAKRDGFDNLLLLCGIHHPIIDIESETYTVDVLKKMKADHERKYMHGVEPTDEIIEKLLKALTENDKDVYINMLRSEIELCISELQSDNPQLLPVDRWTSAVNSGVLTLFKSDESEALSGIYHKIKGYNHVIESEHFDRHPWKRLEYEDGSRLPRNIVKSFLANKASLLDELRTLKNAEWLNP
jgi:hypothetical protein